MEFILACFLTPGAKGNIVKKEDLPRQSIFDEGDIHE
jgi:hypothetical protein